MSFTSGPFAVQAQRILDQEERLTRRNTKIAYDRKGKEFLAFCKAVYSSQDIPTTVTEEKVFGFLFYQAYRPCRKRGRKRNASADVIFDLEEFNSVINQENISAKPVAYDVVNQYLCSILKIWKKQVDMNANNLSRDQIRSERVQRLLMTVKTRKKTVARLNFEEKLESEFLPFLLVEKIPSIEMELFRRNAFSKKFCLGALRDRFCFLMTNGGILRGESLFNSELSDLCDLIKEDEGPHKCHILVMRIAVGKTNALKTLYGRVMRHKDFRLCPIGALAMYFLARFHLSGESLDFSSNDKWFNVKLLVESSSADTTTSISNQTYAKTMRQVCSKLGINSKHFVHFGRSVGAVKAELEEMDALMIKNLGNWNPDTQEDRYSAKLPLQAMRIMAGHDRRKGFYYLPRAGVEPPAELRRQIFPFVDVELSRSLAVPPTAKAFLQLLDRLRTVILQDAAAMILADMDHMIFQLPFFKSDLFNQFTLEFKGYVTNSVSPSIANVDAVLPGLQTKIDNVHADIQGHLNVLTSKVESVSASMENVATVSHMQGLLNHIGQYDIRSGRSGVSTSPSSVNDSQPNSASSSRTYCMFKGHRTMNSIWNEWHGLQEFSPDHNPSCFLGGIRALESETKRKWRSGWSSSEQKFFSRIKFLVTHTQTLISSGLQESNALTQMDAHFERLKSISAVESFLKQSR